MNRRQLDPIVFGPPKHRRTVMVEVTADASAFLRQIRRASEALTEAARPMLRAFNRLSRELTEFLADERIQHGPDTFEREDGALLWQSTMCAVWFHRECPLPGRCDCTCHGGSLR